MDFIGEDSYNYTKLFYFVEKKTSELEFSIGFGGITI